MSVAATTGIIVGVLVGIISYSSFIWWCYNEHEWVFSVAVLVAIITFGWIVVNGISAHANHHEVAQPVWLLATFVFSVITAVLFIFAGLIDRNQQRC